MPVVFVITLILCIIGIIIWVSQKYVSIGLKNYWMNRRRKKFRKKLREMEKVSNVQLSGYIPKYSDLYGERVIHNIDKMIKKIEDTVGITKQREEVMYEEIRG